MSASDWPAEVVDLDVPAPQLGGDAAGEVAVGGHEGCRACLGFERLAQGQGDHEGFVMGRRAVGARHMGEGRGAGTGPDLAGLRRPHQLADQLTACGIPGAARPIGDGMAFELQGSQQFAQAELRMAGFELGPALAVHLAVEAGQHDGALRQAGNDRQEFAGRGLRAGRPRGDDLRRGRLFAPPLGLQSDRARAAVEGVDLPTVGQNGRPMLADDGQEAQRVLPVVGKVAVDQSFEFLERHAVDGQLVEQAGEFAGELERLGRRLGNGLVLFLAESQDQLGEQCFALGGLDSGRQGERGAVAGGALPVVVVDIAQRRHARQQCRLAAGGAQEGFAQRPHGTPRRHEDQHVGQSQRIVALLGQHAARQLVGKAPVDADREDALHPSTRSASASACGVPIWNHWPSCTSAWSWPACSARVHSFTSEKGLSGAPWNKRESQIDTLAKR